MIEILLIIAVAIATISVILLKKDAQRIKENERLITELAPQNPISFYESMKLCNLPIVTFKIGNEDINFMLDSGGMRSFIDSRAVVLLNLPYEKVKSNINVYGITGNIVENEVIHMNLSYKDSEYESDFVAQDLGNAMDMIKEEYGVRIHGMLGTDFFEKYKYVLDFKDLIAYTKK